MFGWFKKKSKDEERKRREEEASSQDFFLQMTPFLMSQPDDTASHSLGDCGGSHSAEADCGGSVDCGGGDCGGGCE